uniref:R-LORF9 protein n=1 Tax=Gallid alphaherpesvirus 3 TaxID=35250 RepID=A0A5J6NIV9_9ALPH|nr:R-LORF9 protein [Gallid alphaherpesvirus 3]QEY02270.1 R-LORF9 protein [Gallid alphaherpesvirus 3]
MGEGTASRTRAGVGHGRWRGVGNAATPRPVHVVMRGIEFPDGEELSAHRSRDQRICHIYATPRPSPHEQGRGSRFVAHTSTLTFAATMKIVSPDQLPLYVLTASDGTTEFSIRDWSLWDRDPESRAGTHRGLRQTERSLLERCRLGPGPSRVRPAISLPPPPPEARAGPRLSGKVSPAGSGGRGKDVCVIRNRAGPFYVSEFEHALTSCSHRLKPSDRVRAPGQPSVANVWKSLWSLVSRAVRGNAEGSYGRPEEGDAETAV